VSLEFKARLYIQNNKINTIPGSFVEATKKTTLLCFRSRENLARVLVVIQQFNHTRLEVQDNLFGRNQVGAFDKTRKFEFASHVSTKSRTPIG
jgi:hypothetical protein